MQARTPKSSAASRIPRCGFTLIELVVCIGIIAVLAGLVFSVLHGATGRAQSAACINNLKQIYQALQMYEQDHGALPGGSVLLKNKDGSSELANPDRTMLKALPKSYVANDGVLICPSQPAFQREAIPKWGWRDITTNYCDFMALGQKLERFYCR